MSNIKYIVLFSFLINVFGCGASKRLDSNLPISKEVSCIEGISSKDYKYLAWGIGSDNEEAETDALKAALYAAMVGGGAGECTGLMSAEERSKSTQEVEKFFAYENQWRMYVRNSTTGRIDSDKRRKLSDGSVKLGVEAVVDVLKLKEDLIKAGIIKDKLKWGE